MTKQGRPLKDFGIRFDDKFETPCRSKIKKVVEREAEKIGISVAEFVRRAINNYCVQLKIKLKEEK